MSDRPRPDVLLVSLGTTAGLREADAELAASLRRAGAAVAVARAGRPREVRTFALTDLSLALSARRAAVRALAACSPRSVVYSSTTAALLAPVPGAVRFDAPSAANRPGRHGLWQRPRERAVLAAAPLLVPWSAEALAEAAVPAGVAAVVVPVPVEPSGPPGARDVAAITYGANPAKKGVDRVLAAWSAVRREGEELLVAGLDGPDAPGVRHLGAIPHGEYRALLRRARVFVTAPRREDHGIAQLEALADGCALVTWPSPGPYAALPLARALDPRLVTEDLGAALRAALDAPAPGYAERAAALLAPWRREAIDAVVRDELLPRLTGKERHDLRTEPVERLAERWVARRPPPEAP
ncbi:MAG TPA: glycosyltransferase [Solirubrobacteraceae bacterium]